MRQHGHQNFFYIAEDEELTNKWQMITIRKNKDLLFGNSLSIRNCASKKNALKKYLWEENFFCGKTEPDYEFRDPAYSFDAEPLCVNYVKKTKNFIHVF